MAARSGLSLSTRAGIIVLALATGGVSANVAAHERLNVSLDEARLIRLPDRVATIIIGNPLIVDASLQPGGVAVLTGKGYGATNFIALDRKGNALLETTVEVRGAFDTVTVYKGVKRETYNCSPTCQPIVAPGDEQRFFNETLVQGTTRSTQASAVSASR